MTGPDAGMPRRDVVLALLVTLVWGANFVVIERGLPGVPPLTFAALRFLVVLVPAIFLVPRPAAPWREIALVGTFLSMGQFALLYTGIHLGMPPGLASLVLQAQVMFTVAFASVALHEPPTRRQLLGVLIGVVGLVVVGSGRASSVPLLGFVLVLAAAASWATGNILSRRTSASGLSLTVWSSVVVPVPLLALSLLLDGPSVVADSLRHLPGSAIWSTLYTAYLSTLFAYGVWNALLTRHRAASVVPFTLLVPVVGVTTAWIFDSEMPNAAQLVGGALLLAGVGVTTLTLPSRARASAR